MTKTETHPTTPDNVPSWAVTAATGAAGYWQARAILRRPGRTSSDERAAAFGALLEIATGRAGTARDLARRELRSFGFEVS